MATRPHENGDEFGITTLFLSSDPRHSRSVHYWRWSNSLRWNRAFLSQVSLAPDQNPDAIIGHYGFGQVEVAHGDQTLRAGFGQQAVIHKNFRDLTTLVELYQAIQDRAADTFDFLFGFPNDQMFPLKAALFHWQEVAHFRARQMLTQQLPRTAPRGLEIRELHEFPAHMAFDSRGPWFTPVRSSSFLNWRFMAHPVNHYTVLGAFDGKELVGYLALKLYQAPGPDASPMGHFIDYWTRGTNTEILSALMARARQFFEFNAIDEIWFWNTLKPYDQFLAPLCTDKEGFATHFGIHPMGGALADTGITQMGNWSFSMADSDAF